MRCCAGEARRGVTAFTAPRNSLRSRLGGAFQIGGQQVGRLAVIQLAALTLAVGSGRHYQQSQRASARAALPVHPGHLLVAYFSPFAPIEDLGLLPGTLLILTRHVEA